MKQTSQRTKIITLSILSTFVLAFGVGIALSMQSYEDPIDQQAKVLPLGNYDYSKRPFIADWQPTIYKGDIYWKDPYQTLRRIPLSELSCDMRTLGDEDMYFPQTYSVCTDNSHDHNSEDDPVGCFDYGVGSFLIDAYESNGGSPIIYRTRILDADIEAKDEYGQIIRYDTGNLTGETLVSVSDLIGDMMTYDQWVFFVTNDAEGIYSINVVSKQGGEVKSLKKDKYGCSLLHADDHYVYYQDNAGNIYRATLDLQNSEFVYYAETISAMQPDRIGTFIHGDYLYFEADYETVPYSVGLDTINFAKHSIRRVSLNNLNGASELVAENVLDNYVFGVGNNVLYYQPCIMAEDEETSKKYYFNWTGGQLLGVNLDTLEQVEMVNDVALNISGKLSYAIGNALFVTALPTDGRYNADRNSGWGMYRFLLDTRTGALYPICGIM